MYRSLSSFSYREPPPRAGGLIGRGPTIGTKQRIPSGICCASVWQEFILRTSIWSPRQGAHLVDRESPPGRSQVVTRSIPGRHPVDLAFGSLPCTFRGMARAVLGQMKRWGKQETPQFIALSRLAESMKRSQVR